MDQGESMKYRQYSGIARCTESFFYSLELSGTTTWNSWSTI